MVKLYLEGIECRERQDLLWDDEPYLLIAGKRIDLGTMGNNPSKKNTAKDLRHESAIQFDGQIIITLMEQDMGIDADDDCGSLTISADLVGRGQQQYQFTGAGAHYVLYYRVDQ